MGFSGFSHDLLRFLKDLEDNNSRDWFTKNRSDYEALLLEPARRFVETVLPRLQKMSSSIHGEPRVNGSIKRINRDVRFSKDKSPYKPALHLVFWQGGAGPRGAPSYHFHLTPTTLGFGAGLHAFVDDRLTSYRQAVCDELKAAALRRALAVATNGAGYAFGAPELQRVPRGFRADGLAADLLRHKGLHVQKSGPVPNEIFGPAAAPYVTTQFEPLVPLQEWLVAEVSD